MFHISYKEVDQNTFNEHLRITEMFKTINTTYEQFYKSGLKTQRYTRFLNISQINATLTYKIGKHWISVKTNMAKKYDDDIKTIKKADPIVAYAIFARVVKPIKYSNYNIPNLGGYQNSHPDKKGYYQYAICYDVNKSYFNACNNLMPTEMIDQLRKPRQNEVGFKLNGKPVIGPSNDICPFIFKLERIEGLDRYIKIYTNKLKKAKDKYEKQYYKDQINMSIGNLANHNPFLRNMIIWYSNNFIESKVDENTIWSNTDSIVSTVKRDDLKISDEIGDFKIEHEGRFIQNITGYQWLDDNKISNKGLSKDKIKLYEERTGKKFILGETDLEEIVSMKLWEYSNEKNKLIQIN